MSKIVGGARFLVDLTNWNLVLEKCSGLVGFANATVVLTAMDFGFSDLHCYVS